MSGALYTMLFNILLNMFQSKLFPCRDFYVMVFVYIGYITLLGSQFLTWLNRLHLLESLCRIFFLLHKSYPNFKLTYTGVHVKHSVERKISEWTHFVWVRGRHNSHRVWVRGCHNSHRVSERNCHVNCVC